MLLERPIAGPEASALGQPTTNVAKASGRDLRETQYRYDAERKKRLRPDGPTQYVGLTDEPTNNLHSNGNMAIDNNLQQNKARVVIVGAGFGGLLFAVRLLQSGFLRATEILFVDTAGGFGGTWWWNKYPGLACDIESYTYMPLLEETNYMPSQKYVTGPELREHANRIADQWNLSERALFQTKVNNLAWNDQDRQWTVHITPHSQSPTAIQSDFVILATGLLNSPKLPKLDGLETYKGKVFHTSRWDYDYTGGSPSSPTMHGLQDKTVGFVGTGASAVQAIPHLAQWAKKVVVFQRTPSAVDWHHNHSTDRTWWAKMVQEAGSGWQRERMENFNAFPSNENPLPDVDLVDDGWTKMQSFSVLIGSPSGLDPDHLTRMQQLDLHRQEAIRHRVEATVTDQTTARALKPWYPGWCKRPCFSDNFLTAFNQSNVSLVDTNGKGIHTVTNQGILANSQEYDLDAIIFGTGYSLGGSADLGDLTVTGRNNQYLHEKRQNGLASLHGVMTSGFPNLFFSGPYQTGASVNQVYVLDQLAVHVAHIISEAGKLTSERNPNVTVPGFTIEPSPHSEGEWTVKVLMRARALGGVLNCTPSYYNREGLQVEDHEALQVAQFSIWGEGIKSYVKEIENWRQMGGLVGLNIQS
ncbi:hypothetical protein N7517_007663 [Penicillium concentricum]|uniref:FAD/NAD(P)-binding domain-containing protein n=1 Tax=Penicillium concentricum TaxID=293559 RepID=A0A9W9VBA6_9EURO|nr:uncharacterized protein N7517_007663 [Penicillium concentricum]KAJ5375657.1 hypothetical protein N7517_007663 [Penicillium concentricum]